MPDVRSQLFALRVVDELHIEETEIQGETRAARPSSPVDHLLDVVGRGGRTVYGKVR